MPAELVLSPHTIVAVKLAAASAVLPSVKVPTGPSKSRPSVACKLVGPGTSGDKTVRSSSHSRRGLEERPRGIVVAWVPDRSLELVTSAPGSSNGTS